MKVQFRDKSEKNIRLLNWKEIWNSDIFNFIEIWKTLFCELFLGSRIHKATILPLFLLFHHSVQFSYHQREKIVIQIRSAPCCVSDCVPAGKTTGHVRFIGCRHCQWLVPPGAEAADKLVFGLCPQVFPLLLCTPKHV